MRLREELQLTEDKLKQATVDLKHIGDSAVSEKEEQKVVIRQKMARKMRTVSTRYHSNNENRHEQFYKKCFCFSLMPRQPRLECK